MRIKSEMQKYPAKAVAVGARPVTRAPIQEISCQFHIDTKTPVRYRVVDNVEHEDG